MPIRLRIGRGGNGRLSARILASQLAILALTGAIGFVLFAVAQRAEIDRAYEQRALDIARTTAAEPQVRQAMEHGGDGDIVQTTAERIRKASGASYVVVIDLHGIRHSHPDPALVGKPVDEPIVVLDGHPAQAPTRARPGVPPTARLRCTGRRAHWSARFRRASRNTMSSASCGGSCPPSACTPRSPSRSARRRRSCWPGG